MVAAKSEALRVLVAAACWAAGHSAVASTNEQFAAQVRAHRIAMAQDPSAVRDAAAWCAGLPPGRAMDDPRCVAWHLHVRAQSDQERSDACETGGLPAISHIRRCLLDGLAGSAA